MTTHLYPPLSLRRREARRIRAGHPWIYSNEVDTGQTPLRDFEAGQPVTVLDHRGQALGNATLNPHSLICARLLTRDPGQAIDTGLLVGRLRQARALRDSLFATPHYRAVFSEADFLPGLVVDRFGDVLVAQLNTAGMETLKDSLTDALREVFEPRALLWCNDAGVRELEGLPRYRDAAFGEVPEQLPVEEGGLQLMARPWDGQKTGWFFDQRSNRDRVTAAGARGRGLDLFSYLGGWGLRMAAAGAEQVLCVDSSAAAVEGIEQNIRSNQMQGQVSAQRADVFELLKEFAEAGERFDWIVVDPPAFAKRRKDLRPAIKGYQRVNQLAMQLLSDGGQLISCSCSYHVQARDFEQMLAAAGDQAQRSLQLLMPLSQGPDHPLHPALTESAYLKGGLARVLPGS